MPLEDADENADLEQAELLVAIDWHPTYQDLEDGVPVRVLEFWKELKAGRAMRPEDKPVQAGFGVIGGVPIGAPPVETK